MSSSHFQVSFMPWADIERPIEVGGVTFWPFQTEAAQRISDKAIRDHLEKYFRYYVDHQGQPVDSITICSHGPVDFRQLNATETADVRAAVDVLIFSIICPATKRAVCANNNSMGPPSADRYQLITQNFRPGEDHIAVQAGSVLSGGWKIGEISFPKPWSIGGFCASPNTELLEGFSKVLGSSFPAASRERMLRGLEWFRLAHVESEDVSPLSKIVMMATAFEIALDVPNVPDKSGWIADEVAKRCGSADSLTEVRKDRKGGDQIRPKIGWWAWDFYKLRNAIVHGDAIKPDQLHFEAPERAWLTHLVVADLVLWECMTRELYAHRCVGDSVRKFLSELGKMFPNQSSETIEPDALAGIVGFDFESVHRALGWAREPEGER